jgi:hypothetical protein
MGTRALPEDPAGGVDEEAMDDALVDDPEGFLEGGLVEVEGDGAGARPLRV